MKYLSDYMQDRQTALFEKTNTFFAFSQEQFDKKKKPGIKYTSCGQGMICESRYVKELKEGLDLIYKESIIQDLKENGKVGVITRELHNHEAGYTMEIDQTVDKLEDYPITTEEIFNVFKSIDWSNY